MLPLSAFNTVIQKYEPREKIFFFVSKKTEAQISRADKRLFSRHGQNIPSTLKFEPRHEKTNVLVSNLVRHKPGCTDTEDG